MYAVGVAVNKFLDAWKKVEEIREIREKVRKMGITGVAYKEFTDKIQKTVDEVVEEVKTALILQSAAEQGRTNELAIALDKDLIRLLGQIERGLVIEIRVEPPAVNADEPEPKTAAAFSGLKTLSRSMQFPLMNADPILLATDEGRGTEETAAVEQVQTADLKKKPSRKKKNKPGQEEV